MEYSPTRWPESPRIVAQFAPPGTKWPESPRVVRISAEQGGGGRRRQRRGAELRPCGPVEGRQVSRRGIQLQ